MLAEAINTGPRVLESQKIAIETEAERQAREVCIKSAVLRSKIPPSSRLLLTLSL